MTITLIFLGVIMATVIGWLLRQTAEHAAVGFRSRRRRVFRRVTRHQYQDHRAFRVSCRCNIVCSRCLSAPTCCACRSAGLAAGSGTRSPLVDKHRRPRSCEYCVSPDSKCRGQGPNVETEGCGLSSWPALLTFAFLAGQLHGLADTYCEAGHFVTWKSG